MSAAIQARVPYSARGRHASPPLLRLQRHLGIVRNAKYCHVYRGVGQVCQVANARGWLASSVGQADVMSTASKAEATLTAADTSGDRQLDSSQPYSDPTKPHRHSAAQIPALYRQVQQHTTHDASRLSVPLMLLSLPKRRGANASVSPRICPVLPLAVLGSTQATWKCCPASSDLATLPHCLPRPSRQRTCSSAITWRRAREYNLSPRDSRP